MLARPAPRGVLGLLALVLALACGASDPVDPPPPPPPGDRVPLIDGTGLYGGGRSTPPAEHHTRGLQAAAEIRPEAELVVVVVVGMSNAVVEWRAFMERAEGLTNAHLIETACAGCTTELWDEPSDPAYVGAAEKIERSGFDEAGVRVAWIKTAKSTSTAATVADFEAVLSAMRARWPNLEQVFVSSRIYGGYSHVGEPAAYDSGPVLR
ncbi:MAG TPA: hypothetical protein VM778_00485, partial [Gemmatimonadota bacterium]|nr:hypothetical protein [Gemmatimonadota bacterium]